MLGVSTGGIAGAGLMSPPMSVLGHTVVSSRSDGELYI